MFDQTGFVFLRRDLPKLLQTNPELRRLLALVQIEFSDELFGQRAARALADQRVLAAQFDARGVATLLTPVAGDAEIAGDNTRHPATVVAQQIHGGETRENVDLQRLGLFGKPATKVA